MLIEPRWGLFSWPWQVARVSGCSPAKEPTIVRWLINSEAEALFKCAQHPLPCPLSTYNTAALSAVPGYETFFANGNTLSLNSREANL